MTTLTPELRQAYHDAIQSLFGGVVKSSPSDISQGVVNAVDKMMKEIVKCSAKMTGLLTELLTALYDITAGAAVGSVISKYRDDALGDLAADKVNETLKGLLEQWVNQLLKNKQFVGCLNTARANWRSVITMELMGI